MIHTWWFIHGRVRESRQKAVPSHMHGWQHWSESHRGRWPRRKTFVIDVDRWQSRTQPRLCPKVRPKKAAPYWLPNPCIAHSMPASILEALYCKGRRRSKLHSYTVTPRFTSAAVGIFSPPPMITGGQPTGRYQPLKRQDKKLMFALDSCYSALGIWFGRGRVG